MTQSAPHPASLLETLARWDTPTICNALEVVAPEHRLIGFTTKPLVCPFPDLPPMVGYARTATIRATSPSNLSAADQRAQRVAYYEYCGTGHGPRISVIQDLDGREHRLRRILGRGQQFGPQGARLSRRRHRRIDP